LTILLKEWTLKKAKIFIHEYNFKVK
jgi:hypothetical protein